MSKFLVKQAFAEAMDLHKNGRFEEAKEIYNKILKVDASEPNAHHLISLIFMAEGNLDDAKSHIELAELDLGLEFFQHDDFDDFRNKLESLVLNDELRTELSKKSLKNIDKLSWSSRTKKIIASVRSSTG